MSLRGKQLLFLEKFGWLLPDRPFLKWKFRLLLGYRLDLDAPRTFNEKIQWLKLNDRNPLYTMLADKNAVKAYVASKIGGEHVIPTIGCWRKVSEIDFDSLPERYVLKCNHDSGSTVICRDSSSFGRRNACIQLDKALSMNYFLQNREWSYRDIEPSVMAETYLGEGISDYKFFCFNGIPEFMFVATDRDNPDEETKFDFFDMDFNHLPVRNGHPNSRELPQKPSCWEEMKRLAAVLSEGLPHVRVDLYEVDGKVYFGEYTFYHWGGFVPFDPPEWDLRFGEKIKLK